MGAVNTDGSEYIELKNQALYVKNARSGRMMGLIHNLPKDPIIFWSALMIIGSGEADIQS